MGLTTNSILNCKIHEGAINGVIFREFINDMILELAGKGQYTFLFDNVAIHKNKAMLDDILSAGHKYINTPPYSPNNNPIENVFSILKHKFRTTYDGTITVKENISNSLETLESYTQLVFKKIFTRAFTITYENIEIELRDRMHLI